MPPNPPFVANEIPSAAKWNTLVGVYVRRTNEIDVVSTVTETDLLKDGGGTALAVTAGHLSSDRMIRATILGDVLNNTGGNVSFTYKVKLGGTDLIADGSGTIGTSSNRRPFRLQVEIANLGATNSQWVTSSVIVGGADATTGIGDLNATDRNNLLAGTGAKDSTGALNLEVTVTLGSNSANYSFRKKYALVELM